MVTLEKCYNPGELVIPEVSETSSISVSCFIFSENFLKFRRGRVNRMEEIQSFLLLPSQFIGIPENFKFPFIIEIYLM